MRGARVGNDIGMEESAMEECSCIAVDPKLLLGVIINILC